MLGQPIGKSTHSLHRSATPGHRTTAGRRCLAVRLTGLPSFPFGVPLRNFRIIDFELQLASLANKRSPVATAHDSWWAASCRFERHMQHHAGVRRTSHAGLRDAHPVGNGQPPRQIAANPRRPNTEGHRRVFWRSVFLTSSQGRQADPVWLDHDPPCQDSAGRPADTIEIGVIIVSCVTLVPLAMVHTREDAPRPCR